MFYIIVSVLILFAISCIVLLVADVTDGVLPLLMSATFVGFAFISYFNNTDDTNIYSLKLPIEHINNLSLVTIGDSTEVLEGVIYIQSDSVYVNYFERVHNGKVLDTIYKFEPVLRN